MWILTAGNSLGTGIQIYCVSCNYYVGSFDENQRCPVGEVLAEEDFERLQLGCLSPDSPHFHLMAQYQACSKTLLVN